MCKRMLLKMQVLQLMQRVLPSGVWDATSDTKALCLGGSLSVWYIPVSTILKTSLVYSIELEFQIKRVQHSCKVGSGPRYMICVTQFETRAILAWQCVF